MKRAAQIVAGIWLTSLAVVSLAGLVAAVRILLSVAGL